MFKTLDRNPVIYRGIRAFKGSHGFLNHFYNTFTDPEPKIIILAYHRVLPKVRFDPFRMVVTLSQFIKQIDAIAKKYSIVNLDDIIYQLKRGKAEHKTQIILTFDDGYYDNYKFAFPVLAKKGLTATFFLTAGYINNNPPWDWQIMNILCNNHSISKVEIEEGLIKKNNFESRLSFAFRVFKKMKSLKPQIRQKVIDYLNNQIRPESRGGYARDRCITWEEAIEMSRAGMEIGSHGLSHSSLAMIPFLEAKEEIEKSKEIIEYNLKKRCNHFSFPYGAKRDYNQQLIDCVKKTGYQACILNIHGYNHFKKDTFCFKRIIMEESTNPEYLLG